MVDVHTFSLQTYLSTRSLGASKQILSWPGEMPRAQRIIMEVGWVADDALIVKEIDRPARDGSVILFTQNGSEGKVVRRLGKDGEEGDDGWIDHVRCHPTAGARRDRVWTIADVVCVGPGYHPDQRFGWVPGSHPQRRVHARSPLYTT